jgi:hypothetical protein
MKYREPLFSVHGNEGRLAIYLEEQVAVYGKVQNIRTEEGFDTYSKHRDKLDPTVLLIAMMSEDEALTLAEQILITVRAMREPATPRLEIVK